MNRGADLRPQRPALSCNIQHQRERQAASTNGNHVSDAARVEEYAGVHWSRLECKLLRLLRRLRSQV